MIIITCILLIFIVGVLIWSYWSFNSEIKRDINIILKTKGDNKKVITSELLEKLPAPVARHLKYAGVVGKSIPNTIYLKQLGKIRKTAKSKWMNIDAEQYYSTSPPSFIWKAYMPSKSLPIVLGRDRFIDGKGSILMKMFSLFPVANQQGQQMHEACLIRYLNEMMWFPQAYLGENITWREINDTTAEVTLKDRGLSVKAKLYIDMEGKLTNFSAQRYNTESDKIETWETPITKHGEFDGLRVPVEGKAVYRRASGDLEYISLIINYLKYD